MPLTRLFQRFSVRRLVALVAALCVVSSSLEALLPDVHDADGIGQAASVMADADRGNAVDRTAEHERLASFRPTAACCASHAAVGGDACEDGQHRPADSGSRDQHPFHVDHCTHGHSAVTSVFAFVRPPVVPPSEAPSTASDVLVGIEMAPHVRPPIA
jgi:hypothetical protein